MLLRVLELDEDETERNKKVAGLSSFEQDIIRRNDDLPRTFM
jgi:hypothetical protein